jgi:hypothetical protein
MAISAEDFYRSSNGDLWQLICDTASGRSFVRHEPNLSSGGRTTDTDVEEFLNRTGSSPSISRCGRSWIAGPHGRELGREAGRPRQSRAPNPRVTVRSSPQ